MTQVTMEMIEDALCAFDIARVDHKATEERAHLLSLIRQYGEPQWVKVEGYAAMLTASAKEGESNV